jgi:ATP-dependent Clp protease ATP-binding subunit ClpX
MVSIGVASSSVRCSFCGRTGEEVHRVLVGPRAKICDECLRRCRQLLAAQPA